MPAIKVARTDTFEIQRQKINQIGDQIFSISQGGSDLATGNLKIGDGTKSTPSLAFVNEVDLGIYRPENGVIGVLSQGKKVVDFSFDGVITLKNFTVRKTLLTTSGVSLVSRGQNYDPGDYTDIDIIGGTGSGAKIDLTVTPFGGQITNAGSNYSEGSYSSILLEGGSGTGAAVNFTVPGISGFISNSGSGYVPGSYSNVPLTNGSGSGAEADLVIDGSTTYSGTITPGSGYTTGVYTAVEFLNVPATTYTVTVSGGVYAINGVAQDTITLVKGNTYKFNLSDATNSGNFFTIRKSTGDVLDSEYYTLINKGSQGSTGVTYLIIAPDAPTETIEYSSFFGDVGGDINVTTGSVGSYGNGAIASIEVDGSGAVSVVTFSTIGTDYQANDALEVFSGDIGGTGNGFQYTINSIVYTGQITSVAITDNGIDYQEDDVLNINNSSVGGFGSGFAFTVSNTPGIIESFEFSSKGSGYTVGDVLVLSKQVTGVTASLKGSVTSVSTTLSDVSAVITVADTTGIVAGMLISQGPDVGVLAPGTTVQSVDSATQITLSAIPDTAGAANLNFTSPGILTETIVSSTTGILPGFLVTQTAGTGIIAENTTVLSVDAGTNTVTLSLQPDRAGSATLSFIPPYGDPADDFEYTINVLGEVETFSISEGGNGYSPQDVLSVSASDLTQPIVYPVTNKELVEVTFTGTIPSATFSVGDSVKERDGSIVAVSVTGFSNVAVGSAQTYSGVSSTSSGSGTGATFDIVRSDTGDIISAVQVNSGYYYAIGDTVTISGALVGGSSPSDDVTLNVDTVSVPTPELEIYSISTSGGNIDSILIDHSVDLSSGDVLVKVGSFTEYTTDTVSSMKFRFFIDTGSGPALTPNLSLFVNNIYKFDISDTSNSGHIFSLSSFRDGIWGPSLVEGITSSTLVSSKDITVSDATGILVGMAVFKTSGDGDIATGTTVAAVNGTTITLSEFPTNPGALVLTFRGVEYTEGVSRSSTELTIKVSSETPTLYYYCAVADAAHTDEGGEDNAEAQITIDPNNPKVFGSGLSLLSVTVQSNDVVVNNVDTGDITATSFTGDDATLQEATVVSTLTTSTIVNNSLITNSISSPSPSTSVSLSGASYNFDANISIGATIQLQKTSGNITSSGYLKTTNYLNVNDVLTIDDNVISTISDTNLVLSPFSGRVTKVTGSTALVIPSGTTNDRPGPALRENGSIRFNTETNQYEGYNATTTSWSSLGGVRDIDGNTYILAELTAGANDNTLWFYNDSVNTLKLTSDFLDFRSVKKISSAKLGLPAFSLWTANTAVSVGQYLKYRNNIYEVTGSGTTATTGSEPTHTSGASNNGTAQLTWYSSAVSPLTFTEIEELRVAPNKDAALVINGGLKLGGTTSDDWNTISTLVEDLTIAPNPGKRVIIKSYTHLAIPAGNNNQKNIATAIPGSIRFNTEIQQFEGYSGTNWSSLGGVRDVDGNTYIIPESAPAANENILYFYNDNLNTMQLTRTSLDFTNIDTITTSGLNNLSIDTPLVTLNSNDTTIDNRDVDRTFISTSKQFLDLGLSSGLVVDPVLRLDDQGDVYLNTTFGTGSFNGVKVFDGDLKEFELADYAIKTSTFTLAKGSAESSAVVLYPSATNKGCKVTVVSRSSSGKRSMTEYSVIDNGTDIFHNEYGSLNTSLDQYTTVFDYNATNEVRISLTLSNDHANGDIISFTVLTQVIK